MGQKSRALLATDLATLITALNTTINDNINTNGVNAITGAIHNSVLQLVKTTINTFETDVIDSFFNIDTDNSDIITEGAINLFATPANLDAWLTTKTTTDLAEGTNLYYTDARVDTRINTLRPEQAAESLLSLTASGVYTASELQAVADKVDALIAKLQGANILI